MPIAVTLRANRYKRPAILVAHLRELRLARSSIVALNRRHFWRTTFYSAPTRTAPGAGHGGRRDLATVNYGGKLYAERELAPVYGPRNLA
jgi:hypothetical protein